MGKAGSVWTRGPQEAALEVGLEAWEVDTPRRANITGWMDWAMSGDSLSIPKNEPTKVDCSLGCPAWVFALNFEKLSSFMMFITFCNRHVYCSSHLSYQCFHPHRSLEEIFFVTVSPAPRTRHTGWLDLKAWSPKSLQPWNIKCGQPGQ